MRNLFAVIGLLLLGLGGVLQAQEQEQLDEITLIAHFEQPGKYTLGVKFSGTPGEKFLIEWWGGRETISMENTNDIEWSRDIIQETSETTQYDVTIYSINPTGHILSLSIDSVYKYNDLYLKSSPELTALQVAHNNLKVLVLFGCHDLTYLDCSYNRLTTIDYMDKADSLIYLDISHNLLDNTLFSPLATQHYQVLKHLICNNTLVDGIVLDNLPALETFECSHNSQLTGLSLISMPALETVKFTDNPLCTGLDMIDCPLLDALNLSNNVRLGTLDISNTGLRTLDLSIAPNLKNLYCSRNDSLTTLSIDNPKLEILYLYDLPSLQYLSCRSTLLSGLSFSAYDSLPSLRTVECSDNPLLESLELTDCQFLDSLDFTNNIQLKELTISHTELKSLDLSVAPNLENVSCSGNDSLTTLSIDNPKLEYLSLHDLPALQYLSCRNTLLSALHFTASDSLPSLRTVECSDNPLLESLELADCQFLDSLDFTNNIQLKELTISHTELKSLDLSVAPNLENVSCSGNDSLTMLKVDSPVLKDLQCDHNRLDSLLINGIARANLTCNHNRLTSLSLPSDVILESLTCDSNGLLWSVYRFGKTN